MMLTIVGLSLMNVSSCSHNVSPPNTRTNTPVTIGMIASLPNTILETVRDRPIATIKAAVAAIIPNYALPMKKIAKGPTSSTSFKSWFSVSALLGATATLLSPVSSVSLAIFGSVMVGVSVWFGVDGLCAALLRADLF